MPMMTNATARIHKSVADTGTLLCSAALRTPLGTRSTMRLITREEHAMAVCEVGGNDFDKSFAISRATEQSDS